jgi:hypothetical protein
MNGGNGRERLPGSDTSCDPIDARVLKRDVFGTVSLVADATDGLAGAHIQRDLTTARWWARPLAYLLAAREARALGRLGGRIPGVPTLIRWDGRRLTRSYIAGRPMQHALPSDPAYFRDALHLVRRLHAAGVVHNDLAKEPNWLVTPQGEPAVVDFQLASTTLRRNARLRMQGHDDLRHLLKHKRTYCADRLTQRQRRILASPSLASRLWKRTGKPLYLFVTRRLLGWADREGAGDRGTPGPH